MSAEPVSLFWMRPTQRSLELSSAVQQASDVMYRSHSAHLCRRSSATTASWGDCCHLRRGDNAGHDQWKAVEKSKSIHPHLGRTPSLPPSLPPPSRPGSSCAQGKSRQSWPTPKHLMKCKHRTARPRSSCAQRKSGTERNHLMHATSHRLSPLLRAGGNVTRSCGDTLPSHQMNKKSKRVHWEILRERILSWR